ncbi:MAG: hypothetical protein ACR2OY_03285 [Boseongicola sp.]
MSYDNWRGVWIAFVDNRVQHGFSYRDGHGIARGMEIRDRTNSLANKMSAQLRVKGDSLAEVTQRAGRKLPNRLRQDAQVMIDAEALSGNPKLARRINAQHVAQAERRLNSFLDKQNPAAERRGEFLDALAKIAFVLVLIVLGVFFVLLYRGYFD